jgi:hypothetical protein
MSVEVNPAVCASCGEPNACGLSQGKADCWCFSVKIEQEALARIPAEKRNLACICAGCAAAAAASPGAGSEPR